MKLRTITKIAAITQLLALFCLLVNYARLVSGTTWENNAAFLLTQPVYILAQAMLVAFLFFLVARQHNN